MDVERSIAFKAGKGVGLFLSLLSFSFIFSFLTAKFTFNLKGWIITFVVALVLVLVIQWMMKKQWL